MLKRLSGFSLFPLIGAVTPFLLLPIVARVGGPDGWTAIGIGQSVGIIGGITTQLGWWMLGPAWMSQLSGPAAKHALYVESLQQRGLVFLILAPIVVIASTAVTGSEWAFTASLTAVAGCAAGLAPSWYSIGDGKPLQMVLFEDIPKAVAMIAAAILVVVTRQIWIYPALLLMVSVTFPVLFGLKLSRSIFKTRRSLRQVLRGIRGQASVTSSGLVSTSYSATPVPIASILAPPPLVASFVSAEKLYRLGLFAVKALGNGLQSWVIEGGEKRRRRQYFAIGAHALLGGVGGGFIAFLGPPTTEVLFGRDVAASSPECIAFGLAFLFLSLTTPLARNILVPGGRNRLALIAVTLGAMIGIPMMVILGTLQGIDGVGFGLAASQGLVFLVSVLPAIKSLRGDAPLLLPGIVGKT